MKLFAPVACLAALLLCRVSSYSVVTKDHFLKKPSSAGDLLGTTLAPGGAGDRHGPALAHYGDTACPCIGFDGIEGEITLQLEHDGVMQPVSYPREVGARCEAWDWRRHPSCLAGSSPEWCGKRWCFVDPCNCNIDTVPEQTTHFPFARYRGHPVAFSHATCDGDIHEKHPKHGSPGCRCIGFENAPGTIKVTLTGTTKNEMDYPASLGGTCKAWDLGLHPECKGDDAPSWCKAQWCYVDACACKLEGGHVPKISSYLPKATFTGMSFYYSYETCGSEDIWTKDYHETACVNQATEALCKGNTRCAWTGERCLGKELVNHPLCKEPGLTDIGITVHSGASRLAPTSLAVAAAAACMVAAAIVRSV